MPPNDHSTSRLFARFREGDPEAFRALIEPHLQDLEACAKRRLDGRIQRKVSAADVVQEAQMIAFQRCADFDGHSATQLRRWLRGIVSNRARKAANRFGVATMRAVGRELSRGERPDTIDLQGEQISPSVEIADRELRGHIAQARERLSHEEQELLRLVHDELLNLRQAAERLGRRHDAVRKQYARAVMRLGRSFRRLQGEDNGSF